MRVVGKRDGGSVTLNRYPMPQAKRRSRYGDPFAWTLLISLILHALVLAVRFGVPGSESGAVQAVIEPLQLLLAPEPDPIAPEDRPATRIDPEQAAEPDAAPAVIAPPSSVELVVSLVQKPAPEATAPKPKARQTVARKATRMRTATPVMTTHQDGQWAVQTDADTTEPAPIELADAPVGSANVDIPADPATPPAIPAVTSEPTTQDNTALAAAEAERQQAEELARAEQARVAAALAAAEKEKAEQQAKAEAARKAALAAEQQRKEEAARLAAEASRKQAEDLARAEAARLAMAQQAAAEKQRADEASAKQRVIEEQARQAEARKQAEAKAELTRKAAEQQAAQERQRAEEAARLEQARVAEAARQRAEQQARADAVRQAAEQAIQEKLRADAIKAEQARIAAEAAAQQRAQAERARAEAARQAEQQAAAERQRQEELTRAEQARAAAEAQKRAEDTARAEQARKVAAEQVARAAAESAAQSGKGSGSGVAGSGSNPGSGSASDKGITVPLALPPSFSLAERALQQLREREPVRDPFEDKRPRMRTAELSRSHIATETDFRFYSESFKLKVERIGALNPPRFLKNGFQMSLVLTAVINSDGSLAGVYIKQGSGDKRLDDAAKRIVVSSSPFAPFSPRMMARYDQVEITRTWNFVDGTTTLAY
ncbi:TonB family protein [Chitinimonas sp. BJYL2]|uniref:TonB family protein n=1 Tax=Chitinimonas sp. BJYL2 TaxID=2976696 RepID=UPI0022B2EB6B|nr:TonB family protein [Chitinimonas sp. BJYL2]